MKKIFFYAQRNGCPNKQKLYLKTRIKIPYKEHLYLNDEIQCIFDGGGYFKG